MSLSTVDDTVKAIARATLTERQWQVWALHIAGCGTRRIELMLGISRSVVREHLDAATRRLARNGVVNDGKQWKVAA